MSTETNQSVGTRVISAFFDTTGAAQKAVDDLVAAGIPSQHISQTGGQDAEAGTAVEGGHRGFWEHLKDLFLPDEDRATYSEGLRRGGFLVAVRADEANYNRVIDILDTDGAVDIDHRAEQWRNEGWTRDTTADAVARDVPAAGLMTGSTLSAGASAPAIPNDNARMSGAAYDTSIAAAATSAAATGASNQAWRSDEAARAAALDGSVPATAAAAGRLASRDDSHGRARLRSYVVANDGEAPAGSFSPQSDAARIVEHMDVISADGQRIGTVDHLDGPDRIKLAKSTSPDGQHHMVPFAWIDHVDRHVHLKKTLAEIKAAT